MRGVGKFAVLNFWWEDWGPSCCAQELEFHLEDDGKLQDVLSARMARSHFGFVKDHSHWSMVKERLEAAQQVSKSLHNNKTQSRSETSHHYPMVSLPHRKTWISPLGLAAAWVSLQ